MNDTPSTIQLLINFIGEYQRDHHGNAVPRQEILRWARNEKRVSSATIRRYLSTATWYGHVDPRDCKSRYESACGSSKQSKYWGCKPPERIVYFLRPAPAMYALSSNGRLRYDDSYRCEEKSPAAHVDPMEINAMAKRIAAKAIAENRAAEAEAEAEAKAKADRLVAEAIARTKRDRVVEAIFRVVRDNSGVFETAQAQASEKNSSTPIATAENLQLLHDSIARTCQELDNFTNDIKDIREYFRTTVIGDQ